MIGELRYALAERFPGMPVRTRLAGYGSRSSSLSIAFKDRPTICAECSDGRTCEIRLSPRGDSPQEHFDEVDLALARIFELIGDYPIPDPYGLTRFRESLGLSRADIAAKAGMTKVEVAEAESFESTGINEIARLVRAMGGRLVMRFTFPGRDVEEVEITGDTK